MPHERSRATSRPRPSSAHGVLLFFLLVLVCHFFPLAAQLTGSGYSGYDVVLIAGQSNAVGNSATPDPVSAQNDDTTGLPVFYLEFGIDPSYVYPNWDGSASKFGRPAGRSPLLAQPTLIYSACRLEVHQATRKFLRRAPAT